MTIQTNELSVDDSRPIELVEIAYSGKTWYFTGSDADRELGGRTYRSIPLGHAVIEPSVDVDKAGLEFYFPPDVEFGEIFRIQPPSEVVSFRMMIQNYMNPSEFITAWRGRIINVDWQSDGNSEKLAVIVENVYSSLQRLGLRRRYSITCPYALYGPQCRVPRDDFKETTPISGYAGLTVMAVAAIGKPDNYYAGGFMTYANTASGNVEKRMIRASVGATGALILSASPIAIAAGILTNIYAGCDHLISTCDTRFNNAANSGATPHIPRKNPFGGATLY